MAGSMAEMFPALAISGCLGMAGLCSLHPNGLPVVPPWRAPAAPALPAKRVCFRERDVPCEGCGDAGDREQ